VEGRSVREWRIVGESGGSATVLRRDGNDADGPRQAGATFLDRIAERYLKIDCAVFTPNADRRRHVQEMTTRSRADGVIHYAIRFCTPYLMESHGLERSARENELPFLRLETDYNMEDAPQLETRIQAFLEILR
jgi:benzoyl-CoA reductase/2-hydroxyglutaryl-CoA dehydratase subunit BcrC/BadD/HgdB